MTSTGEQASLGAKLILTVSFPALTITKKMLFFEGESIRSVLDKIAAKIHIPRQGAHRYGLFLPTRGRWCQDESLTLQDYDVHNKEEIEFKLKHSFRFHGDSDETDVTASSALSPASSSTASSSTLSSAHAAAASSLPTTSSSSPASVDPNQISESASPRKRFHLVILNPSGTLPSSSSSSSSSSVSAPVLSSEDPPHTDEQTKQAAEVVDLPTLLAMYPNGVEFKVQVPSEEREVHVFGEGRFSAGDLVSTLLESSTAFHANEQDFGIITRIIEEDGTHRLDYALPMDTLFGQRGFDQSSTLIFGRIQFTLEIEVFSKAPRLEHRTTMLCLQPHHTVHDLRQRIISQHGDWIPARELEFYEMVLLFSENSPYRYCGVVLDKPKRVVCSYDTGSIRAMIRFANKETLQYVAKPKEIRDHEEGLLNMWFQFEVDGNPQSHYTCLVDRSLTVNEAVQLYFQLHASSSADEYSAYYQCPGGDWKRLEDLKRLKSYDMVNMQTIVLKRDRVAPGSSSLSSSVTSSGGLFGVEPSRIPRSVDPVYKHKIPTFLTVIHDVLVELDAFTMEGIFRVAGAEPVVQEYISLVNQGTFEKTVVLANKSHSREEKVHALATLIVRWLGDLPKGILGHVPAVVMDRALQSLNSTASSLPEYLPADIREVFLWLMQVLTKTTSFQEKNRMNSSNLAIVFAPLLLPFDENDPMKSLVLNKTATALIGKFIEQLADPSGQVTPRRRRLPATPRPSKPLPAPPPNKADSADAPKRTAGGKAWTTRFPTSQPPGAVSTSESPTRKPSLGAAAGSMVHRGTDAPNAENAIFDESTDEALSDEEEGSTHVEDKRTVAWSESVTEEEETAEREDKAAVGVPLDVESWSDEGEMFTTDPVLRDAGHEAAESTEEEEPQAAPRKLTHKLIL